MTNHEAAVGASTPVALDRSHAVQVAAGAAIAGRAVFGPAGRVINQIYVRSHTPAWWAGKDVVDTALATAWTAGDDAGRRGDGRDRE